LAGALGGSPSNILQTLVETILEVTGCDSVVLGLPSKSDHRNRFYCAAAAGVWGARLGCETPSDFGVNMDVLDCNKAIVLRDLDKVCCDLPPGLAAITECLLAALCVRGEVVGRVWAIMHNSRRMFDAEDERLVVGLVRFAALAYQSATSIEDLEREMIAREKSEVRMRGLIDRLETKVQRLLASNIVGVFIWNFDGAIVDANEAFLEITGHDRGDLISGRMRWSELTPIEWRETDEQRLTVVRTIGDVEPYVKEFFRKDRSRVPVLLGASLFDRVRNEGVAFVVDLTDLRRAQDMARESERRYQGIQMELLHASRLVTVGQLSASIAHEVNQPIAAAVTNANTALQWLRAQPPNLDKARQALGRVLENGSRAGEVISGIRSLIKKEPGRASYFDIRKMVIETVDLTRSEGLKSGVSIKTELADELMLIEGDRVQLQQVMLNLIVNAFEAMGMRGEGSRELRIATGKSGSGVVIVSVQDSGVGVSPSDLENIFDAFYSTKPGGLGMGLLLCRAIVEAHGGKLWASAGAAGGAIFQFTLPLGRDKACAI
jgi:PAS domain S-box-containing protein